MNGCPCPHAVSEHAPKIEFGQRICLVAGCDCNGSDEEVVTAYVQRSMAKRRVLHDLTDVIRGVHERGDLGRRHYDDVALEIAAEILEHFNVEKKG